MKDFSGRIAVVTGGGSGIGRELVRQLAAAGAHVATCDVNKVSLERTLALCEAPEGVRVTAHYCDVTDEDSVRAFSTELREHHGTSTIHLLFNNAGIGGGGGFVKGDRGEWDRVFDVCWKGVYHCARVFLPLLVTSDEGHIVNVSSVNGFWASLGGQVPHTAYSAAKFAVKGFTEALIVDLRLNAPHVRASVVMPGHIGTAIVSNSQELLGMPAASELGHEALAETREQWARINPAAAQLSDEQVRELLAERPSIFHDNAPTTAAQAAAVILDGVREERWRILVGEDAVILDERVRGEPEQAYEPEFFERLRQEGVFGNL